MRQGVLVSPVMVSMSVENRTSVGVTVCFVVVAVVAFVVVARSFLRKGPIFVCLFVFCERMYIIREEESCDLLTLS